MARKTKLERFNEHVLSKFEIYNSLFLTLPFKSILKTSLLLPLFSDHCKSCFNKKKSPLDQAIYEDASNQLARERVSDKRTYDELSALSTIEKLDLFDNLKMYEEWIKSDYASHLLKSKSRKS